MGIRIGHGKVQRDWTRLASAGAETVVQALALGKDGFSAAISGLFRTLEGLRGDDSVELRATRLVTETLSYAASATLATSALSRRPEKAEAQEIINALIARAETLTAQNEIVLEMEHLHNPDSFTLFKDAAARIFYELRLCTPVEDAHNVSARCRRFVSEGLSRIRTRDPAYFSAVLEVLSGPDALADARLRAWDKYRALLIRRFEDEPLFGEDRPNGVTLAQVYQPLRAWWDLDIDVDTAGLGLPPGSISMDAATVARRLRRVIGMLDDLVLTWLETGDRSDRVRLISGGPGSGKSTFARRLAAQLAPLPKWRVVFVPLQRLRGSGPLEARIDEYFRLQLDEPFDAETAPLVSLGRDEHRDWLIVFDGLDEPQRCKREQDYAARSASRCRRISRCTSALALMVRVSSP